MNHLLRWLVPPRVRRYVHDLEHRLQRFERRLNEDDALIDVLLGDPEYVASEDLGMNGQRERKRVLRAVGQRLAFEQVVETGTFFGATTGYFATQWQLPVWTCEVRQRYFHVAQRILRNCPGIRFHLADSRPFLRQLASDADFVGRTTLFYLDAHWYEDLPLRDEIAIIAQHWNRYVILIDDFQVPGDSGYAFDDYGNGRALCLDFVRDLLAERKLGICFPSIPSALETGKRRGYAFVAPASVIAELAACDGLA